MTENPVFSADVNFFFKYFLVHWLNEDSGLFYHVWAGKGKQGTATSPTRGCSSVKGCGQDGDPGGPPASPHGTEFCSPTKWGL